MNVYTWNSFSKRRNSTKRPSGTGTLHSVRLKEATSIEKPTFVFQGNDFSINYMRAFDHYYFVDDIKSVRQDIIEISCSLDVGATYKSQIGNYEAFVERSYTYRNLFLADPYVAVMNKEQTVETTVSSSVFDPTGFFVVTVLNDQGSNAGFTTYYIITATYLKTLAGYINKDWTAGLADLWSFIQASFLHTADAIVDCIWVPLQLSEMPSGSVTYELVKAGADSVSGCYGYRITSPTIFSKSWSISIPHVYDDFRKGAPYTTAHLYIFGYGIVEINPLDFTSDTITLSMAVDLATGDTIVELSDAGKLISCYTYNIAIPCPVGKVSANLAGTMTGALGTAASIITAAASSGASAVASGIGATASAINTAATAAAPTMSVKGGKGGRAMMYLDNNIRLTLTAKYTTDPDDLKTAQGSIFMKKIRISQLSGYIKCSDASVPIAGMESDKQAVNDLLNGGFYYE